MRRLDAVGTTGGKASVETLSPPVDPVEQFAKAGICEKCGHGACFCRDCLARRGGRRICESCFKGAA